MSLLLAFLIAMAVTAALIPLLARRADAMQVLDAPGERKVHSDAMPRVGGIAMMCGAAIALALLPTLELRQIAMLGGLFLVFLFGLWDDRSNLSPTTKFAGQLLAVFIVVFIGDLRVESLSPAAERVPLPEFISVSLTVFFLLGAINAINLADGLDGLAGGTTLLALSAIGLLAWTSGSSEVLSIAVVLCGAILGFLRFNTWPARVFMGDSGSQMLGFAVGVLALDLTQRPAVALSAALPLLLLGLPAVDTLMVMSQRIREGRSPFDADNRHVHHKLLGLGFDHHEAVAAIYGMQILFFLAAWFMRFESDLLILGVFAVLAFGIVGLLIALGRAGWRLRRRGGAAELAPPSVLRRGMLWIAQPARLPRWSLRTAAVCVVTYLVVVALTAAAPGQDLVWLGIASSGVLVAGVGAGLARAASADRFEWLGRAGLYLGAVMAVYLDHTNPAEPRLLQVTKYLVLPLLVVCLALRIRLSPQRFRLTALDVLLIIVAIVIPNLPGFLPPTSDLGLTVAKLVVLIYAIELFANQSARGEVALAAGVLVFFAVIVTRGFVLQV